MPTCIEDPLVQRQGFRVIAEQEEKVPERDVPQAGHLWGGSPSPICPTGELGLVTTCLALRRADCTCTLLQSAWLQRPPAHAGRLAGLGGSTTLT